MRLSRKRKRPARQLRNFPQKKKRKKSQPAVDRWGAGDGHVTAGAQGATRARTSRARSKGARTDALTTNWLTGPDMTIRKKNRPTITSRKLKPGCMEGRRSGQQGKTGRKRQRIPKHAKKEDGANADAETGITAQDPTIAQAAAAKRIRVEERNPRQCPGTLKNFM